MTKNGEPGAGKGAGLAGMAPTRDQEQILSSILMERMRQEDKWGEQNHPDLFWNVILGEERGEVEKALCEHDEEALEREMVEMIAVGVSWLEARMRRRATEGR